MNLKQRCKFIQNIMRWHSQVVGKIFPWLKIIILKLFRKKLLIGISLKKFSIKKSEIKIGSK
jgi:hypothetical protein